MSVRTWILRLKRAKHGANRVTEAWNVWSITSAVSEHLYGTFSCTGITLGSVILTDEQVCDSVSSRFVYSLKCPRLEYCSKIICSVAVLRNALLSQSHLRRNWHCRNIQLSHTDCHSP